MLNKIIFCLVTSQTLYPGPFFSKPAAQVEGLECLAECLPMDVYGQITIDDCKRSGNLQVQEVDCGPLLNIRESHAESIHNLHETRPLLDYMISLYVRRRKKMENHSQIVGSIRALCSLGCEIHYRDRWERTPLHYAPNQPIVQILIQACQDSVLPTMLEAQDRWGRTPLHEAIRCERPGVVSELISSGAQLYSMDFGGHFPSDFLSYCSSEFARKISSTHYQAQTKNAEYKEALRERQQLIDRDELDDDTTPVDVNTMILQELEQQRQEREREKEQRRLEFEWNLQERDRRHQELIRENEFQAEQERREIEREHQRSMQQIAAAAACAVIGPRKERIRARRSRALISHPSAALQIEELEY